MYTQCVNQIFHNFSEPKDNDLTLNYKESKNHNQSHFSILNELAFDTVVSRQVSLWVEIMNFLVNDYS